MNRYKCNWIDKGISISHRGVSHCCIQKNRLPAERDSISNHWFGEERQQAIKHTKENRRVTGCEMCYAQEDCKTSSDRIYAMEFDNLSIKKHPRIMLVDFSNFCNLKCVMCSPSRSSQWAYEINKENHGIATLPKSFIDEVVKISDCLDTLIVQGGETTIMEENIYFLKKLTEKVNVKNINLRITTNATHINTKFYNLLHNFKNVRLQASIDAYGKINDYVRWPSDWSKIQKNLIRMSDYPEKFSVEIHNTINVLSLFNFREFLQWCKNIENIYHRKKKTLKIVHSRVMQPLIYNPDYAPQKLKVFFSNEILAFFRKEQLNDNKFYKTEIQLFNKSINRNQISSEQANIQREKLKIQISVLDQERCINIKDYIPNFYDYFLKSQ